jgi:hypothetical protein
MKTQDRARHNVLINSIRFLKDFGISLGCYFTKIITQAKGCEMDLVESTKSYKVFIINHLS